MTLQEIDDGAAAIRKLLTKGAPFFVGRNGTIEVQAIQFFLTHRPKGEPYHPVIRDNLEINAGIFPATDESIDDWCNSYISGLEVLDGVAAGWYAPMKEFENRLLFSTAASAFRCPLRSLEPYYVGADLKWTHLLADKRVCVVSSFTKTIQRQLGVATIWTGENKFLLPLSVDWCFSQTGYSPALAVDRCGWPEGITSWREAVDMIVEQVVKTGATVALIGCGGLGMIIGSELKRRGICAIILGGAIQVLFGIKGTRWATHPTISKLWNDAWVWPADDEVPGGYKMVEGGCYW
jgi:hypothetical protein